MNASLIVRDLIARSISHNEVARSSEHNEDVEEILLAECEDSVVRGDGVTEYWGVNVDGQEWRIHVGTAS